MDPEELSDTGNVEIDGADEDHSDGNLDYGDDLTTDGGDFEDIDGEFGIEDEDPDADLTDDLKQDQAPAEADTMVEMDDGTQVALSELRSGFMKGQDYTQKTTELAEERKAFATERETLTQRGQFVEQTLNNLAGFVEKLIPQKPPLELARTDPQAYQYQIALRDDVIAELEPLLQAQAGYAKAAEGFAQADLEDLKNAENAKLIKAMPHLQDAGKRKAFDEANMKAAMDFGFSEEEIGSTFDHRILQLVHFARLGRQAVQNRANAKRRVQAPQKGRKPAGSNTTARQSTARAAFDRLTETGSIDDAARALSA